MYTEKSAVTPMKVCEKQERQWPGTVMLVLSVIATSVLAIYMAKNIDELATFITAIGVIGPLVSISLHTLLGASPIPTETLTAINGIVFGPAAGTFYSWIGYMLASFVEYFIGVKIGNIADFESERDKMPFGLGRLPADSPWFLILGRVVPFGGAKVVGVVGGVYRVSLWRFTWTAALATGAGALIFAYGGSMLKGLF
ncbi:MAG: TVP38/TMEM64 family protein [Anaerolineae bacterium]|nr:TVP38/TMEM64 family protein [Anaerolineae bacterium]